MKTKLTSLFLALAFTCSAQLLKFTTNNLSDIRQLSDSIALNAKQNFKYEKEGISKGNDNYYIVKYTNLSDPESPLFIAYTIKQKGAEYSLYKVESKFTNLYPFWKKFVKQDSNYTEVSNNKEEKADVNGSTYYFKEDSTYWMIIEQ